MHFLLSLNVWTTLSSEGKAGCCASPHSPLSLQHCEGWEEEVEIYLSGWGMLWCGYPLKGGGSGVFG